MIKGGRGYRFPLIEAVDQLDLTNMIVDLQVHNAYSKGGIPLTIVGVANLKIAGHQPGLGHAIERFMGMGRDEIMKIAKDTLEGNLRGVLSQLTPEAVNQDKIAFAEKLLEEAEHDLTKLGLTLDTLKIQNVSDEVKYLDSIGRKQSANVVKRARIAEAEAHATSVMRDAENGQSARLSEITSEMEVVRAETERRIKDAQTRKMARVAEEVGTVKAQIARATGRHDGCGGAGRAGPAPARGRRDRARARRHAGAAGRGQGSRREDPRGRKGDGRGARADDRDVEGGRRERARHLPHAEGPGADGAAREHDRGDQDRSRDDASRRGRRIDCQARRPVRRGDARSRGSGSPGDGGADHRRTAERTPGADRHAAARGTGPP